MNTIAIICSIIGAIGVVLGGVWFIIKRAFDKGVDKNRLDNIEAKIENANCDGHSDCIKSTTDLIEDIKNDLSTIKIYLSIKSDKAAAIFSVKSSPRKLNIMGEILFDRIKGNDFLDKHQASLFDMIDAKKPMSALDVEIFAKQVCIELVDDPIFKSLKDFVYNSPSLVITDDKGNFSNYDVTINDICFVISIPLRDIYLRQHTEIKLDE